MAARGWQHRAMRYEPSQRLLRLARHLAASRAGLTLDEMAAELEVGPAPVRHAARPRSPVKPVAGCMEARLAVERRRGGATGNIVTEASL